jgi:hypothetical protein
MPDNPQPSPVQAPPPPEFDVIALKQQPQIDPVTGQVLVARNPAQESAPKPGGTPQPEPVPAPKPEEQPQPQPPPPPQQ